MTWTLLTDRDFDRELKRLDRQAQRLILSRLLTLAELEDPRDQLKPLSGPLAGLWRYRIDDYRVIVDVRVSEVVLVALDVGRRDSIYG
ncbi:MAG TPA: type II toxin-antitoxin system RelE/ParE family toxin [Pseudolysinimonas sp.]|nr:type II toxin-antitoxin system RelE/ParE family toxin [Pseudolysinimonas sp.]